MKFYYDDDRFPSFPCVRSTKINVVDGDTFTVAAQYKKPCCLNFASHKRPGGGYEAVRNLRMPIKTQEEDLFRRSNLPELMDVPEVKKYYPLKGLEAFYCEAVVSKDKELNDIPPFEVSVITMPAVVNPNTYEKRQLADAKAFRIIEIAAANDVRDLILGAWGCGVFANDPEVIAKTFQLLLTREFSGIFDNVVFAIPGKNSHNYQIFEEVLSAG